MLRRSRDVGRQVGVLNTEELAQDQLPDELHQTWLTTVPGMLAFTRGDGFACVVNCSDRPVVSPVDGELLHAGDPEVGEKLPPNAAAWWLLPGESSKS
ncbi:hypothetical protein [Actinopolymorpha sp. B9G3]|uniref:hypothetical protein n=1 Tax=Actinopolymorpha sp. B9G3 TaxID=3158970 RepID=UPI0032D901A8